MSLQILITTFESVALLLGVGVLGLWIISKRMLPQEALGTLSTLALDIALPSLVFVQIIENFKPSQFPGWWLLPVWWLGFTAWQGGLTVCFSRLARQNTRREFAVSLFFQNALFFPLAILSGMFGADSPYIVQLFFFILFFPSLLFSTAHLFFGQSQKALDWSKILNKVFLATIAAASLRLLGIEHFIPDFVISALDMIGGMALPLLLLILGGNLYVDFQGKGSLYPLEVGKFLLIKNFIFPVLTLCFLVLLRPPYHIALLILLEASVPPITAIPILTGREGGNRDIVNQFLFSSFAVSLISIPLMIGLFNLYFQSP